MRATDAGGLTFDQTFTISVTDVNEAPTDIALDTVATAENQPAGHGRRHPQHHRPDRGDTFTYTLVSGTGDADNASFPIDAAANC